MKKQKTPRTLSPYSLKWFYFCMYFRYPLTILKSFVKFGQSFISYGEYPHFLYLLDIILCISLMVLLCIATAGCPRFKPYGLKCLYAAFIINMSYSILCLLLVYLLSANLSYFSDMIPHYFSTALVVTIGNSLEMLYYYKRRSLFRNQNSVSNEAPPQLEPIEELKDEHTPEENTHIKESQMNENFFYMPTWDGEMMRVPESKVEEFLKMQEELKESARLLNLDNDFNTSNNNQYGNE